MYKILNELKSKLHIEYYLSPRVNGDNFGLLEEEHGINTNIMRYCEWKVDDIMSTITHAIDKGEDKAVYIDNNVKGLFFQKVYVRTQINYGNKFLASATYQPKRTYINKEDRVFGEITIALNVTIQQIGDFSINTQKNALIGLISHELNHAFEHYNRYRNNKASLIDSASKNGYFKNTAYYDENEELNTRKLSFIFYHLYKFEVNSYIAELIQEVRPELKNCDTSKEAWNVIRQSSIMKKYINVEKYIEELQACIDEKLKRQILDYYNSIRKKKVNNYGTMIKILTLQYIKVRKQIVNRLSKQITDIAMQSDKQWGYFDGPNMMKTEI